MTNPKRAIVRVLFSLAVFAMGATEIRSEETPKSPQTQRTRELIYLLRQYRVFSRDEEWARTLRELVEIGKPAVPELVAELDRTERNSTLRSLGFVLRAIGDPRAVPALIRAIPKTRGNQGSDCGANILDPDLRAFMLKNQNHPQPESDGFVLRGRPVNEIVTALEILTGHPIPHPGNRNDDRRERWLAWWEEHKNDYPIEEDLREVAQRRPDDDPVDQAGVAKFGPLFPTGPDWRLGPVCEVTLDIRQYANGKAFLDFDSDRVFETLEARKPSDNPLIRSEYGVIFQRWEIDQGIDLRNDGMLGGQDLNAWLIEDDRWKTLEDEIRSGERLKLGRETTTYLEPFANGPNDFKNDRIGTFLFTTREGGRGIVQVFPERRENDSRRLQYRLFESVNQSTTDSVDQVANEGPTRKPSADARELVEPGRFGKTATITLSLARVNAECLLNLGTGQTYTMPIQFEKTVSNLFQFFQEKESAEWCQKRGIDVVASSFKVANFIDGGGEQAKPIPSGLQLLGANMTAVRLLPKSFYHLRVENVEEIFRRNPVEKPSVAWMHLQPKTEQDVETYAIRTSDGTIGLIKLEQVPDEPDKILIRYRLHPPSK